MAVTLQTAIHQPGKTADVTPGQMKAVVYADGFTPAYDESKMDAIVHRWANWSDFFGYVRSCTYGQSGHETGWFWSRVEPNQVQPSQNNWGGLGADNTGAAGATFGPHADFPYDDPMLSAIDHGIVAFMCHLSLYVHGEPENWPIHTRQYAKFAYRLDGVRWADKNKKRPDGSLLGFLCAVTVVGDFVNCRWAESSGLPCGTLDNGYAKGIVNKANEVHAQAGGTPMTAQIPGFKWQPADSDHYKKGRSVPIRGFAVHYTGRPSPNGSSLNWLTKTSVPPVSSTFLIKHNPTMEDRGWQLVRIEDTPWTTAFANPYTVSSEYEQMLGQSVPAIAYEVMAQTIIDTAAYVKQRQLGGIPLTRTAIRPHREWVGNPSLICSDGVMVDRIVAEIERLQGTGGPVVDFSKVKTEPDPWRDHLGGNPYGRSFWIPSAFVKNINDGGGFGPVGFVTGGAFVDGPQLVQYFERARLELNENSTVTRGLVGLEALAARDPSRLP